MSDINFNKKAANRGSKPIYFDKSIGSAMMQELGCQKEGWNNGKWRYWFERFDPADVNIKLYSPICPEYDPTGRAACQSHDCSGQGDNPGYCCGHYSWGPECCNGHVYCCIYRSCESPGGGFIENCEPGKRCKICPPPADDEVVPPEMPGFQK